MKNWKNMLLYNLQVSSCQTVSVFETDTISMNFSIELFYSENALKEDL